MKNQAIKNPQKRFVFMLIKKLIILKKYLSQFQGKETTQISNDVIDQIQQQIKKERIGLDTINTS